MRYIVGVIAALILSTACYGQERPLLEHSCGKYLAAAHGHAPGRGRFINHPKEGRYFDEHVRFGAWFAGFLDATNFWMVLNQGNGIQTDDAALDVWIRKWCEKNPTKSLGEAAVAFILDQRGDYLKGWAARQVR
jgi:hypothetical protein